MPAVGDSCGGGRNEAREQVVAVCVCVCRVEGGWQFVWDVSQEEAEVGRGCSTSMMVMVCGGRASQRTE